MMAVIEILMGGIGGLSFALSPFVRDDIELRADMLEMGCTFVGLAWILASARAGR